MDKLIVNTQNKLLTVSGNALKVNWLYGYVTDGLVLLMDGIDKGGNDGNWTDLKDGHVFTPYGSPTFNSNHIYFDGTDDYLSNSSFTPISYGSGTIEIVVYNERTSGPAFVFAPKTSALMAHLYKNNFRIRSGTSGIRYDGVPAYASISATKYNGYANGVEITNTNTGYYSTSGSNYIGARNSNGMQAFFKGRIYSIRIYNRELTKAEVMNNWWIDNRRFNIQ